MCGLTSRALSYPLTAPEWSLRETEFADDQLPNGGLTFRQRQRQPLRLGSGFDVIDPCTDEHFGAVIKAYRERRTAGDDDRLRG